MKKALIAIASAAVFFLACKKEEPVVAKFWPLVEGNKWTTTESYSYDVEGLYVGSGSSTTRNEVGASQEREDGKLVWPVTSIIEQGDSTFPTSITYYYVTEDSVYMYSLKDDEEPQAVEPNNLAVGVEWNGNLALPFEIPQLSGFPTEFPAHFKVVGTATDTVPAGIFDCLVIKISLPDYNVDSAATQWRAEGIGMVKMNTDFQTTYSLGTITFDVDIKGDSKMTSYNFQ
jgi:hypothetical protein